jgi:hypothetical protein
MVSSASRHRTRAAGRPRAGSCSIFAAGVGPHRRTVPVPGAWFTRRRHCARSPVHRLLRRPAKNWRTSPPGYAHASTPPDSAGPTDRGRHGATPARACAALTLVESAQARCPIAAGCKTTCERARRVPRQFRAKRLTVIHRQRPAVADSARATRTSRSTVASPAPGNWFCASRPACTRSVSARSPTGADTRARAAARFRSQTHSVRGWYGVNLGRPGRPGTLTPGIVLTPGSLQSSPRAVAANVAPNCSARHPVRPGEWPSVEPSLPRNDRQAMKAQLRPLHVRAGPRLDERSLGAEHLLQPRRPHR